MKLTKRQREVIDRMKEGATLDLRDAYPTGVWLIDKKCRGRAFPMDMKIVMKSNLRVRVNLHTFEALADRELIVSAVEGFDTRYPGLYTLTDAGRAA